MSEQPERTPGGEGTAAPERTERRGPRGERTGEGGGARRGRRPHHRSKVCEFCVDKTVYIDYKDLDRLRNYLSETGKILPRRNKGVCARHQRMLTVALKRARMMALLPFTLR